VPRYDFSSLSSQDLEDLARDLLQAEWNVALEAFKSGRDKGIDLRYAPAHGDATVIQCKHYARSGFNKLLTHLRTSERDKIKRLRPRRYVVVTSVELTPANKDVIIEALEPFVLNPSDVIGANDLDGLLSRHPSIERANFKLWLTSSSVIERVVHNAEICRTEFELDRIRRKLPLFVQSDALPRAAAILDESRIVVISGMPGIGKTTLAEILLYMHLEQGYEPVVIQSEVAEGRKFFSRDGKRIFYYDDFLGQSFLGDRSDYLGRNQDTALVDFMDMVRSSAHSRFILTTREHILGAALQISERLARSPIVEQRCIIQLHDYSLEYKARILYNHLYFSELPWSYKEALLQNDYFLRIIKHEHFIPRLIEWLSTQSRVREVSPDAYRDYVSRLLQSPNDIWHHAFRNQISKAARDVLLCVYTMLGQLYVDDLEPAFRMLHRYRAEKYNFSTAPGEFRSALQELDGAFLSYGWGQVSYLNPSVREFIGWVISQDSETAEDICSSAVRFIQIIQLWQVVTSHPGCASAQWVLKNPDSLEKVARRLISAPETRWEKSPQRMYGIPIDVGKERRIAFLVDIATETQSFRFCAVASQAADHLISGWERTIPDFGAVVTLLKKVVTTDWFREHGGRNIYRKCLNALFEHLVYASASDWIDLLALPETTPEWISHDQNQLEDAFKHYREAGVREERWDSSTLDHAQSLRSSLEELGRKWNVDFATEIQRLDEDIAEREEAKKEEEEEHLRPRVNLPETTDKTLRKVISDDEIRQMFGSLSSEE
jgi:hypothetical protein